MNGPEILLLLLVPASKRDLVHMEKKDWKRIKDSRTKNATLYALTILSQPSCTWEKEFRDCYDEKDGSLGGWRKGRVVVSEIQGNVVISPWAKRRRWERERSGVGTLLWNLDGDGMRVV